MYNRKFYLQIFSRIGLILAVCVSISFANSFSEKWFTIFGLFIILVLLVAELVRFIFRVGNNVSDFIVSLRNNDTTMPISGKNKGLISDTFTENLKELQQKVSYIKTEQVVQALFIEELIKSIDIGIVAFLTDGKLKFINDAFLRLMDLKSFRNVQAISSSNPDLYQLLTNLKPGDDKLLSVNSKNGIRKISVKSSHFKSKDEEIKLVLFQDIKNEIDESLLQSWQNLIRILTHEINNTVSPIVSLADSLSIYLSQNGSKKEPVLAAEIDQKSISNSFEGVSIIKERSEGLVGFVSKYRSLLPKKNLTLESLEIGQLFYRTKILLSEKLELKNISISSVVTPDDLKLNADRHYIEQVLINLITNSAEAFDDFTPSSKPSIKLSSFRGERGEIIIQVADNGKGISEENLDRIFIPFYSTKENGSGIGLSLSMQIIRLHGGSLSVKSKEGEGSVFSIIL